VPETHHLPLAMMSMVGGVEKHPPGWSLLAYSFFSLVGSFI